MISAITLKAFNSGLSAIEAVIKLVGVIEICMGAYVAVVVGPVTAKLCDLALR
jgi:hypothetical protein